MFQNYWYIIGFNNEIERNQFYPVKILNLHLLLIKRNDGTISVLEDRCCHRNVQLSLGELKKETITCAYHGWEYNFEGECTKIPSLKGPIPKTAKISQYKTKVINDLIWVFIGDQHLADKVPVPNLFEMDTQPYIYTAHEFESDIKFVSESLFDPYHINHVHKNSIKSFMGDLDSDTVEFNVEMDTNTIKGRYERKNNGSYFDKKYFGFNPTVPTEFEFIFPNISKIKMYFDNRILTIYEHMVEIEPGRVSMLQLTVWDNIFKPFPAFAKWFMKRISERIVNEDIAFFKSHFALNQTQQHKDVHTKSDEVSIAFRKLWEAKAQESI